MTDPMDIAAGAEASRRATAACAPHLDRTLTGWPNH